MPSSFFHLIGNIMLYWAVPGTPENQLRRIIHLTNSFWMERIRLRAASQLALLPVMTMVSELLFSAGRSILVLHSSRIYRQKGGRRLKKS